VRPSPPPPSPRHASHTPQHRNPQPPTSQPPTPNITTPNPLHHNPRSQLQHTPNITRTPNITPQVAAAAYDATLLSREQSYGSKPQTLPLPPHVTSGTYYLKSIDDFGRRSYLQVCWGRGRGGWVEDVWL